MKKINTEDVAKEASFILPVVPSYSRAHAVRFASDVRAELSISALTFASHRHSQRLDLVNRFPKAMLWHWHTDGGWMAPDAYWDNLDWLEYVT